MANTSHRKSKTNLPMQKGHLVMWNDLKGFGFIRPVGTSDDYFVHISTFKKGLPRRPEIGDEVHFRPHENTTGRKRASFALIPALEPISQPHNRRFTLNPRPRSVFVNFLILTPLVLSGYLLVLAQNPMPFFAYWILSILTMFLYGTDKAHAATHRWRVPEIYLHILELMGGWPGALIAQNDFRHKTRVTTYVWILRGIIAIHLMAWFIYFYWTAKQAGLGLE